MSYLILDYYQNALLSQAAYCFFGDDAIGEYTGTEQQIKDKKEAVISALTDTNKGGGFTATQAKTFASKYKVVSHISNTASGFSATQAKTCC